MWETSNKYKELIYDENSKCLLNVYIEDNPIEDDNDILDLRISHNLFGSDKVTLGTTPSKSIELQISKKALPEKYENFYIETGLNIDGEDEIVPIGYFTLDEIEKDDDFITLKLVDYMLQFERKLNVSKILPCTTLKLLQYICDSCKVELRYNFFYQQ